MKLGAIYLFIFFTLFARAQKYEYGPIFGYSSYDIEVDGPLIAEYGSSALNIGGFLGTN